MECRKHCCPLSQGHLTDTGKHTHTTHRDARAHVDLYDLHKHAQTQECARTHTHIVQPVLHGANQTNWPAAKHPSDLTPSSNCSNCQSKSRTPRTSQSQLKSADPLPPVPASCRGDRRGMQLEVIGTNDGHESIKSGFRPVLVLGPVLGPVLGLVLRPWFCFRLLVVSQNRPGPVPGPVQGPVLTSCAPTP